MGAGHAKSRESHAPSVLQHGVQTTSKFFQLTTETKGSGARRDFPWTAGTSKVAGLTEVPVRSLRHGKKDGIVDVDPDTSLNMNPPVDYAFTARTITMTTTRGPPAAFRRTKALPSQNGAQEGLALAGSFVTPAAASCPKIWNGFQPVHRDAVRHNSNVTSLKYRSSNLSGDWLSFPQSARSVF